MEICSLGRIVEHFGSEIGTVNADEFFDIFEKEIKYETKYNIVIDDIKIYLDYVEFWITVPEKSELKSKCDFNMQGIYLAKQFKEFIVEQIEGLSKRFGIPKLRTRIHYTSEVGSQWSIEESDRVLDEFIPSLVNEIITEYIK